MHVHFQVTFEIRPVDDEECIKRGHPIGTWEVLDEDRMRLAFASGQDDAIEQARRWLASDLHITCQTIDHNYGGI